MSYATFLADRESVANFGDWWLELVLLDPNGDAVTLRYSHRGTPSPPGGIFIPYGDTGTPLFSVLQYTIQENIAYNARISRAPDYSQSVWNGNNIGGEVRANNGSAELRNQDGGLDRYHPDNGYTWAGQEWRLFYFDSRDPANTIGVVGVGRLDAPQYSLGSVTVNLLGFESAFDVPLSERVYRGTSYMLELDAGNSTAIVNYGQPSKLNQRGSITIMGWLWFETLPTSSTTTVYGADGVAVGRPWVLTVNNSGNIRVGRSFGGAFEAYQSTLTLTTHRWYHIAATISGRDIALYVWDDTAYTLITETSAAYFSGATADTISQDIINRASNVAKFWLDEWSLDNVALDEDDIVVARFAPQADLRATCVHRIGFDDGLGITVTDVVATVANGTISLTGTGAYTWFWAMEGDESLAGKPKPDGWGSFFGGLPVLVDPVRQVYQLTGDPNNSPTVFGAVREGGEILTADTNSASYRAFLVQAHDVSGTATVGGHYQPYLALGMFKMGTAPTLVVTASAGFAIQTPAALMFSIANKRVAWSSTDWDTTQASAIDAAYPYTLGYWTDNPQSTTVADVFNLITKSLGLGYWGFRRGSRQLRINVFTGPGITSNFDWTESEIIDIEETNTQRTVTYEVDVSYFRNYHPLAYTDIAAALEFSTQRTLMHTEVLHKRSTNAALRAKYPGNASISLKWDTLLHVAADAQAVATAMMAVVGGTHSGYKMKLRQPARETSPDDVVSLSFTQQVVGTRLNLDGTKLYNVLSITDRRQDGVLEAEVWK